MQKEQMIWVANKVVKKLHAIIKKNANDPFIAAGRKAVIEGMGQMFSSFDKMNDIKECKKFKNDLVKVQKKNAPTEKWVIKLLNFAYLEYTKERFQSAK